ncbi:MAG: tRNA (adenosine(37)-N6)-threonylcarbamoyltransferase complex dimerization subunit type 1 TsaB, partial [Hyphomicrobiaceae bacterium]
MTILAFDTCFGACSVALWSTAQQAVVAERCEAMTKGHSERIVPMIAEVLAEAGIGIEAVTALAVTIGPGSFTGVRTGIAVARALVLANPRPIHVATSLRVMAAALREIEPAAPIAVAVATRDGLVYFEAFDGPNLDGTVPPCLASPSAAIAMLGSGAHVIGGTGALLLIAASAPSAASHRAIGIPIEPRASALARFANRLPVAEPPKPLY